MQNIIGAGNLFSGMGCAVIGGFHLNSNLQIGIYSLPEAYTLMVEYAVLALVW
jgi:hypothetical protein